MVKALTTIVSLVASVLLYVLYLAGFNAICGVGGSVCIDVLWFFVHVLVFAPVIFIFSLVALFLPTPVVRFWVLFTLLWLPCAVLATYFFPGYGSSGFMFSLTQQQINGLCAIALFAIITITLFIIKTVDYNASRRV